MDELKDIMNAVASTRQPCFPSSWYHYHTRIYCVSASSHEYICQNVLSGVEATSEDNSLSGYEALEKLFSNETYEETDKENQ